MEGKKITIVMILSVLLVLASACQPAGQTEELQVAVIVALTQTAAALESPLAAAPPAAVETQPPGDYKPLDAEECAALREALSQAIGIPGEMNSPVPFEDYLNARTGTGCEMRFSVVGPDSVTEPATAGLKALGWQENDAYAAGGAGGYATAYQNGEALCLFVAQVAAVDANACPPGPGYILCMGELKPEELRHSVILNCAKP